MTWTTAPLHLPKWNDPRLVRGPSKIHGSGIFTRAPIEAGEIVMRWGGVVIPLSEYDPQQHRASATTTYDDDHYLTTRLDEIALVDEALNHSCDPNLWMGDEVTVLTRHPVAAGEELTMDHACWANFEHVLTAACSCRTALCRGRVHGFDWRDRALQSRYAGHFLPCLNRRIARQP